MLTAEPQSGFVRSKEQAALNTKQHECRSFWQFYFSKGWELYAWYSISLVAVEEGGQGNSLHSKLNSLHQTVCPSKCAGLFLSNLLPAYCQLSSQVSANRPPPPGSLPCSLPCIHLLVCTFLTRNCKHPCSLSASSQVVFRGRGLVLVTLFSQHQLVTVNGRI